MTVAINLAEKIEIAVVNQQKIWARNCQNYTPDYSDFCELVEFIKNQFVMPDKWGIYSSFAKQYCRNGSSPSRRWQYSSKEFFDEDINEAINEFVIVNAYLLNRGFN